MVNLIKEIKWFFQRGKRGWADCDIWSFDYYLSGIIINGLKQLKKDSYGCPSEFYDKTRTNDECWKWKEILEEMIQGFEAAKTLNDCFFTKVVKKDGRLVKKIDIEQEKQLTKKFERGISLFGKYYLGLWD